MGDDERIAKSYVWHKGQCYFISTIVRDSSAAIEAPTPRYAETIAWAVDWDSNERGKTVGECGHTRYHALSKHMQIAEYIGLHGEFLPEPDQEGPF